MKLRNSKIVNNDFSVWKHNVIKKLNDRYGIKCVKLSNNYYYTEWCKGVNCEDAAYKIYDKVYDKLIHCI